MMLLYIYRRAVCVSLCLCSYVREYLQNGKSQCHLILHVHTESIKVDIEGVVVFQSFLGVTRFLANPTRLHSHVNFSTKAHQISTKFKIPLLTLDVTQGVCHLLLALSIRARYFEYIQVFKNMVTFVCLCTRIK